MKKKVWGNYKEAGITLLSLILTVVIMLILAAVTINVTLGDGGLVDQAKHAAEQTANVTKSEQQQMDDLASQLNDIIAGIGGTGGTGGGVTNTTPGGETNTVPGGDTNSIDTNSVGEDTNIIEPEPEPEPLPDNTISIGEPQWQDDGTANVTVSTTEPDVTIEYQIGGTDEGSWIPVEGDIIEGIENGETVYVRITDREQSSNPQSTIVQDITAPIVTVTAQGSPSTNSITVTVQAVDNESGMVASPTYTFQIKQNGAGSYTTPDGAENISNATYTFTGLTQGTTYDIQVIVNGDVAGNLGTGTIQATTQTVPGADEGLSTGSITASPATWSGGKASTTLTTTTSFKIQYQINGTSEGSWSSSANSPATVSNLEHGNTVYARLTDGTNVGNYAAITILDGIAPTVSVAVDEVTDTTIKVTVTANDKESGLASSNAYRYYLNDEDTPRATIDSNTYTYTGLTGSTDYTIKVEVVDKGNNPGTGTASARTNMTPTPIGDILEAGDYVYYEDGQGTRQLCAVLYDSSSPYGVEIITMNTVEDITLGGDNNTNTLINSYNNAIYTLNNATSKYNNTIYSDASRSVGSDPSNPTSDNPGYFTSSYSHMSSYNGKFKNSDEHYKIDYDQMETLGIRDIDKYYWLASRHLSSNSDRSHFCVRSVNTATDLYDSRLFIDVNSRGNTFVSNLTGGLRPVFHLKSNVKVTGGTGEEDSPYTLGT